MFFSPVRIIFLALMCATIVQAQWTRSAVPFEATAISSNGDSLWACGPGQAIASSSDGGFHWDMRHRQPDAGTLQFIGFANETLGFAGGTNGLVLLSVDGGASWQQVPASFSEAVLQVSFADARHGIVLTTAEVLYTHDGGKNWRKVLPPGGEEFKPYKFVLEIAALNADTAAVLFKEGPAQFYDGLLITTQDAGETWKPVDVPHTTLTNLLLARGEYWLVGGEVIDREHHGGHAVPVTFHSRDGAVWDRGPKPLIDTNSACHPEGCLMWNGAWFEPFAPNGRIFTFPPLADPSVKNGQIAMSISAVSHNKATQWAAAKGRICALAPGLQCADASVAPALPQRGTPAPSLGASELRSTTR
jgi:hypothetical protein